MGPDPDACVAVPTPPPGVAEGRFGTSPAGGASDDSKDSGSPGTPPLALSTRRARSTCTRLDRLPCGARAIASSLTDPQRSAVLLARQRITTRSSSSLTSGRTSRSDTGSVSRSIVQSWGIVSAT